MSTGAGPRAPRARAIVAIAFAAIALAASALARHAAAQDFAAPREAGPDGSAAAFLECALPAARPAFSLAASSERRFGLAALETRAVALSAGAGWLRAGAGASFTGDAELGWSAAGLALGAVREGAGFAARAVVRRDRTREETGPPANGFNARWPGAGAEAGGGAWVSAAPGLVVWASAPQVLTLGQAPPLSRGLEIGARRELAGSALAVWRRGGPGAPGATHGACFALGGDALRAWAKAEDAPLRGGVGLAARAGPFALSFEIESHPVLPSTVRASFALARGPR